MLLDPVSKIFTPFGRAYKAILWHDELMGFGWWSETHFFSIPASNDYRPSWFPPSSEKCPKPTHDFMQRRRPGSWVCCSHYPSCRGGIGQRVTGREEVRTISMVTHDHNLVVVFVSTGDDSHDILDGRFKVMELLNRCTRTQIGITLSSTSL